MTAITLRQFGGIAPRIPPRYLAESQAQIAVNCPTWLGSLQALSDTSYIQDFAKTGTITSIYRFGQATASETEFWFHWGEDVDVVRGFIKSDTTERTFYTGIGAPKATDNTLALTGAGTAYPYNSYQLGVPQPTTPLSAVTSGTADENPSTETRVYTYTIVNQWDEESAPHSAGFQIDVQSGETVTFTLPSPPTGNYAPKSRRLYRSVSGIFLFVAEIPIGTNEYIDSLGPDELNEQLPSLTWLEPPTDLKGLVGLPGGVLCGFTGIDIYFSEPYRPFAWPVQYQQTVGHEIVGIGAIDTTVVVLTTGTPSFIQGSEPAAMVVVEADVSQACVAKDSIVSMNGVVLYASPDGLISLAPNGSNVITSGVYDKEQWQQLKPESIKAFRYENRYIAFYDTGTVQGGFIYDQASNTFTTHDMFATGGYSDLKTDTLFLVVNNKLHKWESGALLTYQWKSKMFTFPDLIAFTCFRVNAETYPVTFTLYKDGVVHHTEVVTDSNIRRLPTGYGHDYEMELQGQGEVYAVQVAQSPREIASG
jgi:hypothetical protein